MIPRSLLPAHLAHLDAPSADALAHSERLRELIRDEIAAHQGWITFARYMQLALHAPGLGYYAAGATKFGPSGDFVTAPELGDLFARTLARQIAPLIRAGLADVLELGAGSGRLAASLLNELAALESLPSRYLVLETSAGLQRLQKETLARRAPAHCHRVVWLDTLPRSLDAVVLANEVLDAMPVHVIAVTRSAVMERGVTQQAQAFQWSGRTGEGLVRAAAEKLALPTGYVTELNLAAPSLIGTLADALNRAVMIIVDYGFVAREYYHAQRSAGTLMCHYRHHAHTDPFSLVGLQDITAHVDFSALADAALQSGLCVAGYATQAQFLINCGITQLLSALPAEHAVAYLPRAAEAQKLMSPAEMGELFKVIAFTKNFSTPLLGFARGDKRHTL